MPDRDPQQSPAWRAWAVPMALAMACAALGAGGEGVGAALRYERASLAGEPWRLLTGNLVHLGPAHLALNLVGLVLLAALARGALAPARSLLVLIASMLAVGVGLLFLSPDVAWYVGLSGVLHGLLAATAIGMLGEARSRTFGAGLVALLFAKLAFDLLTGPSETTTALIGAPVVVEAHLYGAIGGAVGAWATSRAGSGARL